MRPDVIINLGQGGLGRIAAQEDGVSALILSGVEIPAQVLEGEVYVIRSREELASLGITPAYDEANEVMVHQHLSDFYIGAPEGTELHFMIVPKTVTMTQMLDKENQYAAKLLSEAKGRIRLLGVTCCPAAAVSYEDQFDEDVVSAIPKGQELRVHEFSAPRHRPVQIVIEGRDFQGNATSSLDLRTLDADRVSVVIGNRKEAQDKGSWAAKSAFVGFFLGWLASLPVQRNVGRVRNGALPFQNCTLSNGQLVDKTSETAIGTLNTHGYIFPLTHSLRNGFFFNDDHSATAIESDYAFIGRGRVIDKAARLTRLVLLEELLDDVELNPDNGQLEVSVVKSIEGRVESRINQEMTGRGEISGITAYIDPAQNILEADELKVKLEVVPKGTNRKIIADLGFVNPLINQ